MNSKILTSWFYSTSNRTLVIHYHRTLSAYILISTLRGSLILSGSSLRSLGS